MSLPGSLQHLDPNFDELLVVCIHDVVSRDGVHLDWNEVAKLAGDGLTGDQIKFHISRARFTRQSAGQKVPPQIVIREEGQPPSTDAPPVRKVPFKELALNTPLFPQSRRGARGGRQTEGRRNAEENIRRPRRANNEISALFDTIGAPAEISRPADKLPALDLKIKEVFDPAEPVVSDNDDVLPEKKSEQDEIQRKAMLDTRKSLNDSLLKTLDHLEEIATTQKELAEAQEREMRELRSLHRAMRFNLGAEAGEDMAAQIVADLRAPPPEK